MAAQEQSLSPQQKTFLEWLSAFGEGWAVLAAAGGPDIHPHAEDPPHDRAVWDAAMNNLLQQVADGTLTGDAIRSKGMTFFGDVRVPWYTVGYKMDVTALCDKRKYLTTYNDAARKGNARTPGMLPLWPNGLAQEVGP